MCGAGYAVPALLASIGLVASLTGIGWMELYVVGRSCHFVGVQVYYDSNKAKALIEIEEIIEEVN